MNHLPTDFAATERQNLEQLQLLASLLKPIEDAPAQSLAATVNDLVQHQREFCNKWDDGDNTSLLPMLDQLGQALDTPFRQYAEARQKLNNAPDAEKHVIDALDKHLSSTQQPINAYDLLGTPFKQLASYKAIFSSLLTSNSELTPQLSQHIDTMDALQVQAPRKRDEQKDDKDSKKDNGSPLDFAAIVALVDCSKVTDLFTGDAMDYKLEKRNDRLVMRDDFLLLADTDDKNKAPTRIHVILTDERLLVCQQPDKQEKKLNLLYPALAINDIKVQATMLDRELIGEYTLTMMVVEKSLILRAESRELRNLWTAMPAATTAKTARTMAVPLVCVAQPETHPVAKYTDNIEKKAQDEAIVPVINVSSPTDNQQQQKRMPRVSSIRAPLPNPDYQPQNNQQRPVMPRTSSMRHSSRPAPSPSSPSPQQRPMSPGMPMMAMAPGVYPPNYHQNQQNQQNQMIQRQASMQQRPMPPPPGNRPYPPPPPRPVHPQYQNYARPLPPGPMPPLHLQQQQQQQQQRPFPPPQDPQFHNRPLPNQPHHARPHQPGPHGQQPVPPPHQSPPPHQLHNRPLPMRPMAPPHNPHQQQQQQQQQQGANVVTPASKPLPVANAPNGPMSPQNANNSSQDQADYRPMPPTPPPQQLAYTNNNNQPPAPAPPIASAPPAQPPAAAPQPPAKTNLPPTPNKPDDNTLHDEYASYLHLLPDELASPPRSPNPYNSNNQANGIKQVAFHNDQCEVFRWKDDSWYAVEGHCVLEIRQTYTNRSCIAIRLSSTGDLYLNAWILPHTMVNLASQTDVSIGVSMGQKRENYLIHFQAAGIAQQLEQVLQKEHQAAVVASRQLNGHQAQIGEPPTTPKDNRNSRNMVTTTSPRPTHADQQSMHQQQQHPQQQQAQNPQQQQMQQAQNPHQQQMQQMYPGQPINPQQQQANANAALMTRSSSLMHAGVEPKPIPQTLQKIMQCKCKLFMQNEHSNWSNLGTVLLIVSLQIPSQRMHIQIESDKKRGFSKIISGAGSNGSSASLSLSAPSSPRIPPSSSSASTGSDPSSSSTSLHDPTTPNTMVSATVYSNNVERIGPKRITFLLVNERERSSNVVYMVQFREEQTSNTLYEYLKVKNASHGW